MEDNSPDWLEARRLYEKTRLSLRKIAETVGTTHTSVRNRATSEGWERSAARSRSKVETVSAESLVEARAKAIADADPRTLQNHGRVIIQRLMEEIEASALRKDEIEDLIESDCAGKPNARRRAALMKLLSLESRCKTANYLATALARLNDAAPLGKKAQAQADAERVASTGRFATPSGPRPQGDDDGWGDDLASPGFPRLAN